MAKKLPLCAYCGDSLTQGNEESKDAGGTPRIIFRGPDPDNPRKMIVIGWHGTCADEDVDDKEPGANPHEYKPILGVEARDILAWARLVKVVRLRAGFCVDMIG